MSEITDFDEVSDDLFDIFSEFSSEQTIDFLDNGFSSNSSPSDDDSQKSSNCDFEKSIQAIDFPDNVGDISFSKKHSLGNDDDKIQNELLFPCRKLLSSGSNRRCSSRSGNENKRFKQEDRLIKNREAANKSRMKRKTQMSEMEIKIKVLSDENISLQTDNAALRAENSVLLEQNNFLKSLLSEKFGNSPNSPLEEVVPTFRPNISGVAVLCVVCAVSFWGDSVFPSFFSHQENTNTAATVHHGRVLMSIRDDPAYQYVNPTISNYDATNLTLDNYNTFQFCHSYSYYAVVSIILFCLCYYFLMRKNYDIFVGSYSLLPT